MTDDGVGGGSPFASALREAISTHGTSLSRLRRQLEQDGNPVSMATLSYWRSGERHPEGVQSLTVVEGIEQRLGLRRGHLTSLLEPSKRLGPIAPPRIPFDEVQERQATEETFEALGTPMQDSLRDLSTQLTVYVGKDGSVDRIVMRSLCQAIKGTLAEIPYVDIIPEGSTAPSTISDIVGARMAREYVHPGGALSGFVLELDEPVPAGGTAVIEFTETFPPGSAPRMSAWHAMSRQARETLIWVHFHPEALPSWCEEYAETEEEYTALVRTLREGKVHVARHGFGPGIVGVRWGYNG